MSDSPMVPGKVAARRECGCRADQRRRGVVGGPQARAGGALDAVKVKRRSESLTPQETFQHRWNFAAMGAPWRFDARSNSLSQI